MGTFDPSARLWAISPTPWQEQACRLANRNLTPDEWQQYLVNLPYAKSCPNLP
jgi:hypothetical protein